MSKELKVFPNPLEANGKEVPLSTTSGGGRGYTAMSD